MATSMKAMLLRELAPLSQSPAPLVLEQIPIPVTGDDEVLVRVEVCGVCHTELDEIEGRLPPAHLPIVLGHQVVGTVEQLGNCVTNLQLGQRVGIGWIHSSTGDEDENLSEEFRATGRDVNGGYAQYLTIRSQYAYPIPDSLSSKNAAPLLCAGAIGYRALRLTGLKNGQSLGLMGFGASAHLVLQLAQFQFPQSKLYAFARSDDQRDFARQLGASWAGDVDAQPPESLHCMIDTTPAWKPVIESLRKLRPGGRLVINAIRKEDSDKTCLQELSYHDHLWMEREIKSVANITRHDIATFLPIAAEIPLRTAVRCYALEDANDALQDLKRGVGHGAKVLEIN